MSAGSQSLERGLAILSSFRDERPSLGIADLARELGLSRSTTHRYVSTLAALGYLQQDETTRKYRLGLRVLDLGFSAINSMEVRELAAPYLRRLAEETGHTVNMAILDGVDVVYVERVLSPHPEQRRLDLDLHVGSRLPAYCTSLGKVMLAFQPEAVQRQLLDRIQFTQRGPNTLTGKRALAADLAQVRARGLAVNNEELAYGLRSIAVPIRARSGDAVAAINLAAHRSMVALDDLVAKLGPALLRVSDEISRRIA
jgi:IclR family transcriptional regulator, pca regulon regulatory protein